MAKEQLQICDLNYLYDLAKGDMGFVREMIDVFLEENSGELDKLEKAIAEKDFPEIKQIAHKLRSSIPYVGLDKLIGDDVMEIEDYARDGKGILGIRKRFKKVRDLSEKAISELRGFEI